MNLGLSTTTLENSHASKRHDGIGIYTQALWLALSHLGVEIIPCSFTKHYESNLGKCLSRNFPLGLARSFLPECFRINPKVDIFHIIDHRIVKMNCPVVCTLHDAIPHIAPQYVNSKFLKLKNLLLKQAAKHADLVTAISNFVVPELVEFYSIKADRIRIVQNGVDPIWTIKIDFKIADLILKKYDLKKGYFFTVGTLQPRKNIERIIKAHQTLDLSFRKDFPIVIVGKKWIFPDSLLAEIEKEEHQGFVKWLPKSSFQWV